MKKMLRLAAAFAALAAMTSFIACSNDDDDEDDSSKNGLENTYWAAEDISEAATETVNITLKNAVYVHIEDSSKGTAYGVDTESLDYSSLDVTKTNSVDVAYSSEKNTFTYVVDGSKITITNKYTDDDGKEQTETIEGTIASDKKSFTTTETDDGETVTTTYTKIDKAPENATLVITVAGSDSSETGGDSDDSTSGSEEPATKTYTLDANTLTTFAASAKTDGQEEELDDYFTAIWSVKSKVDASAKTFDDGYTGTQRINFGGKMLKNKNAIKFTTTKAASVKIWWAEGGDDNRQIGIASATDYSGESANTVVATTETLEKNAACVSTLELSEAGTWILGGITNNNYIFKIEVTE